MRYIAEPLQRNQLRSLAVDIRKRFGLERDLFFPALLFLEHVLPWLSDSFYYEIVPVEDFPPQKHADTDVVNNCIRIREDIYYGAVDGNGRDRMTITHEIAHYILLKLCGVKFNRDFGHDPVITYRDPEWQAKALAGEIMCPHDLIGGFTVEQVMIECGVSEEAARFNLKLTKGVGNGRYG